MLCCCNSGSGLLCCDQLCVSPAAFPDVTLVLVMSHCHTATGHCTGTHTGHCGHSLHLLIGSRSPGSGHTWSVHDTVDTGLTRSQVTPGCLMVHKVILVTGNNNNNLGHPDILHVCYYRTGSPAFDRGYIRLSEILIDGFRLW